MTKTSIDLATWRLSSSKLIRSPESADRLSAYHQYRGPPGSWLHARLRLVNHFIN